MLDFLNSLTMEAVIAVLGSVFSIIIGVFGYLRVKPSIHPAHHSLMQTVSELRQTVASHDEKINKLHSRISTSREHIMENKGEVRTLLNHVSAIEKALRAHERRDMSDFEALEQKVDKTMDIVIQILQDD